MQLLQSLFERDEPYNDPSLSRSSSSLTATEDNTASPDGGIGSAVNYCVAAFTGIALFNALELILLIFITFSRKKGLYFWSLLISTLAVLPYSIGFLCFFFELMNNNYAPLVLVMIGWWPMVTGQAVVLYSRLHLISHNEKLLRIIRNMIILNAILFHIPTSTLNVLALGPRHGGPLGYRRAYSIVEKVQMTAFCIQEFIISAVYMKQTVGLIRVSARFTPETKRIMWHLIWINALIIAMDLGLLGIEYASLYTLETTLKGLVYSVKLRFEFAVLGQLVAYSNMPKHGNIDTNSVRTGGENTQEIATVRGMSRDHADLDIEEALRQISPQRSQTNLADEKSTSPDDRVGMANGAMRPRSNRSSDSTVGT